MKEHIKEWLVFVGGAIVVHMNDIIGITVIFLLLFVIDFVTGITASLSKKKKIRSYKLRWSFVKMLCYLGTFAFTQILGIIIDQKVFFEQVLNLQIYVAAYIECVSILENMTVIFPNNLFFKWIHYMLTVEWIKKISGLKEFLKEHKSNQDDQQRTT